MIWNVGMSSDRVPEMLDKPVESAYPLTPLLAQRYSPRAFDGQPIDRQVLGSLLEAVRWTPSSSNKQPWRVIVALREDEAEFARLFACLKEGNQRWAGQAGALLMFVTQVQETPDDEPRWKAYYDVGAAAAMLTVEAMAHGLFVRQMGGFWVEQAQAEYDIPEMYMPTTVLAMGGRGAVSALPEDLQGREQAARSRKGLEELVFVGAWGQVFSIEG